MISILLLATATASAQQAIATARAEPRWELGGAFGHFWQDNERDGDDLALLVRFRLSRVLRIEGELGGVEFDAGGSSRRLGGALLLDIAGRGRVQPYLSLGLGSLASESAEARSYGEVGAGVELDIAHNISIVGDVRMGGHLAEDPAVGKLTDGDTRFARWRAMAVLRF